jgi:hypothetical protein
VGNALLWYVTLPDSVPFDPHPASRASAPTIRTPPSSRQARKVHVQFIEGKLPFLVVRERAEKKRTQEHESGGWSRKLCCEAWGPGLRDPPLASAESLGLDQPYTTPGNL